MLRSYRIQQNSRNRFPFLHNARIAECARRGNGFYYIAFFAGGAILSYQSRYRKPPSHSPPRGRLSGQRHALGGGASTALDDG